MSILRGRRARFGLVLLMKLIYAGRLESIRQFMKSIELPYPLVLDLMQMTVDANSVRAADA